jgi:hypothetical protein
MDQSLPLTIERAKELADLIKSYCDGHELAEAVVEIIRGVVDPRGDRQRLAIAEELARMLFHDTRYFDKAFKDYFSGRADVDLKHDDDDVPPS